MGSSRIISFDEVEDCLSRGWIVVVPEFRLCPQVDILSGPVTDVRDCLSWIHDKLNGLINNILPPKLISVDTSRIAAYGMCSGAAVAGCLGVCSSFFLLQDLTIAHDTPANIHIVRCSQAGMRSTLLVFFFELHPSHVESTIRSC